MLVPGPSWDPSTWLRMQDQPLRNPSHAHERAPPPRGSRITGAVVLGSNPSLLLPSCVLRCHLVPVCLTFLLSKMGTLERQAKATCCGATSAVLCTRFSLQDISVSIFHESSGLDRVRDETLWKTGVLRYSSERGSVMTKCGSFLHTPSEISCKSLEGQEGLRQLIFHITCSMKDVGSTIGCQRLAGRLVGTSHIW